MLIKIGSNRRLTLPRSVIEAVGSAEYFDVAARDGQIVLTPVRVLRGDAVRAKLVALQITEEEIGAIVGRVRRQP